MFIGHFALGFAAKRWAPRVSLGTLFVAVQLVDLLWPLFLLTGLEVVRIAPGDTRFTPLRFEHYPWTHSLASTVLWAALFAALHFSRKRSTASAAILAAGVVSHWLLDALSHRPDLPLFPGSSSRIGLGLWNSIPATLAVEIALFAGALAIYARATRPLDRYGRYGLAAIVIFLLAVYAANVLSPPPPGVPAIIGAGLLLWLVPLWAWQVDRHRVSVERP